MVRGLFVGYGAHLRPEERTSERCVRKYDVNTGIPHDAQVVTATFHLPKWALEILHTSASGGPAFDKMMYARIPHCETYNEGLCRNEIVAWPVPRDSHKRFFLGVLSVFLEDRDVWERLIPEPSAEARKKVDDLFGTSDYPHEEIGMWIVDAQGYWAQQNLDEYWWEKILPLE